MSLIVLDAGRIQIVEKINNLLSFGSFRNIIGFSFPPYRCCEHLWQQAHTGGRDRGRGGRQERSATAQQRREEVGTAEEASLAGPSG